MPGEPSMCCIPHLSSWFCRIKNRVSPAASSSLPPSPYYQYSLLPCDSTESLDIPTLQAYVDVSPESTSPCSSISNVCTPFTKDSIPSPSLSTVPPNSPSSKFPLLPLDNTGILHTSDHHACPVFPPASTSHPSSDSSSTPPSAADATRPRPTLRPRSTIHSEHSISHSHHMPPALPQLLKRQSLVFQGPHNLYMNNVVLSEDQPVTDNFMEKLLHETLIGAESGSSDHDSPPRCPPGTSAAIVTRCIDFVVQYRDEGKLRWIVGPAGVGKTAIMQMVIKNVPDAVILASVFFSVNGRRDGSKTIITIACQLAAQCGAYCEFIRDQITLDPSLLQKSLSEQFSKFIVEPFMLKRFFEPSSRVLLLIDGLNECDNSLTQRKLLELITEFCITYPNSPISWIVASRPEPHITSFLNNPAVRLAYTKEEMVVNFNEVCQDVQRHLRDELRRIKLAHPALSDQREWPLEHEVTKMASAAGGTLVYATTVVRYIGDSYHIDPAIRLRRVIESSDASANDHVTSGDTRLDALYRTILSSVPDNVVVNARKLLLISTRTFFDGVGFRGQCNALGLTEDNAYDTICHLSAVIRTPERDQADDGSLSYYHKSFEDFLFDFKRSGLSHNFMYEGLLLCHRTALKILEEVPCDSGGIHSGGDVKDRCDSIPLSWPGDERFRTTDQELRIKLYGNALSWVCKYFSSTGMFYGRLSCFYALTTRFAVPDNNFPYYRLRDCALDVYRDELIKLGKLTEVPLSAFDSSAVCGDVEVLFVSPTGKDVKVSNPWSPSCKHSKRRVGGLERRRGWSTDFKRECQSNSFTENEETHISPCHNDRVRRHHENWCASDRSSKHAAVACVHCSRRFERHFMDNLDVSAMVFVDSTGMCYVEVSFVDMDDGVSEWRYRFLHSGPPRGVDAEYISCWL